MDALAPLFWRADAQKPTIVVKWRNFKIFQLQLPLSIVAIPTLVSGLQIRAVGIKP